MLPKITGANGTKKSTTPTAPSAGGGGASNVATSTKSTWTSSNNPGAWGNKQIPLGEDGTVVAANPGNALPGTTVSRGPNPPVVVTPPAADKPVPDPMDELRDLFSQPATMSPDQRQSYLQMKRDAERAYEQLLANARLQRGMARQDYRTGMRDTARQAAGSAQDMKTALAYLGLDTSPGVADVGVEDINTRANTAMAGLDAAWAQTQAEIKAMKAQARIDRQRALTAAEAWRSRTLGANTQDLQAQLTEILNGL